MNNCICNALGEKTRILVTHQLQYVHLADMIVVLKDGEISEMGSYEQLMHSGKEFQNLIQTHIREHEKVGFILQSWYCNRFLSFLILGSRI
jgi:ABC-type transport system involved in cytochrome bd biosynthesis fused ATPase/permease subunit